MSATDFNSMFRLAAGFVQHTSRHVFLTGKAGTGKTTFLRYLKENSFKNIAIVAPTGVAAINAGGVTMHSFFQLPMGTYLPTRQYVPGDVGGELNNEITLFKNLRLNKQKRELMRELELLVIDEVSMVRADMLDAVDAILKSVRQAAHRPFGGVQVLFIGDLHQLPPVVNNREWPVLKDFYRSPYFFDSLAVQAAPPVYIELNKIYRQSDAAFIEVLNNIRNNTASTTDLQLLNSRYDPTFVPPADESYITLTSHNNKADTINQRELAKLSGKVHHFEGTIAGDFSDKAFPVDKSLRLKVGAQIMFIKNDKGDSRRFFNGKIGVVSRIEEDKLFVTFPGEEGELEVEQETWHNIRYTYDRDADKIEEEELGSFTQYPVRLAWAITIHKSQGLTFDRAVVDAGEAFAAGQVYVALSRLTSMEGMVLCSRIPQHSIRIDERIHTFSQTAQNEADLQVLLQEEQKVFVTQSLLATFQLGKQVELLEGHLESYGGRTIPDADEAVEWASGLLLKARELQGVGIRFIQQLEGMLPTAEEDGFQQLSARIEAAAAFFVKGIEEGLLQPIRDHATAWRIKTRVKKYGKDLETLATAIERKKWAIEHAVHLAKGLTQGLDAIALLQIVEQQRKRQVQEVVVKEKAAKGETKAISLEMFRKGKDIASIAAERNLTVSTIEGHLAAYIETGEVDVSDVVPPHKIPVILSAIKKAEPKTLGTLKSRLGNDYSYGEIKAVMSYMTRLEKESVNEHP
ncbi:helix-turn-helix domain-containing protein [Pseudocnuella soli]|uniref:helix-turn-helix domain-containing protein n=1 Tax=Pseudocnuella soli TaxID=2502779 RepID=UPI00104C9D7A|nr:helix-turn-helix domain-containing protein [Pseudocnuella soli]